MIRFDTAKLVQEIKTLAADLKATKMPLRERWEGDMGHLQAHLAFGKRRATLLCSLRAHTRGRVHIQGSALDAQEALVAACRAEFEVDDPNAVPAPDAPSEAAGGLAGAAQT